MTFLIGLLIFVIGAVVGGVIMFFVFRNNIKRIQKSEKELINIVDKFRRGEKG